MNRDQLKSYVEFYRDLGVKELWRQQPMPASQPPEPRLTEPQPTEIAQLPGLAPDGDTPGAPAATLQSHWIFLHGRSCPVPPST